MADASKSASRIPEFASLKEEAEFWDTHSTTEFEDEWEPVEVEVANHLLHGLVVDFDGETFDQIVTIARQYGIGPAELVRRWTHETLRRETPPGR